MPIKCRDSGTISTGWAFRPTSRRSRRPSPVPHDAPGHHAVDIRCDGGQRQLQPPGDFGAFDRAQVIDGLEDGCLIGRLHAGRVCARLKLHDAALLSSLPPPGRQVNFFFQLSNTRSGLRLAGPSLYKNLLHMVFPIQNHYIRVFAVGDGPFPVKYACQLRRILRQEG